MVRACEPRGDDRARRARVTRTPREVLAGNPAVHVEARHAQRECTVREHVGRDHLAAVCDCRSLQMRVESERVQPVLRAHAVHLVEHGGCMRRNACLRRDGPHKQYESSKK